MRRRKRKKLKKDAVVVDIMKASDLPNAPPLLALMLAGNIASSVHRKKHKHVSDGPD